MKKLLLLSCYLTCFNVAASCNFNLHSSVDTEEGIIKLTKYNEMYESYRTTVLPIKLINKNSFFFSADGKNMNCSSSIYLSNPLFSLQFTPYCSKGISSKDLTKVNDGSLYTLKCADNLSVDVLKKYDGSAYDIDIVPTGFHTLLFSSFVPHIAFKVKNITSSLNANLGTSRFTSKDGYYHFVESAGGYQAFLFDENSNKNASIDVYLIQENDYFKLGSCDIMVNKKNQFNIKCLTDADTKNYKIMSQYNSIEVLDLTSEN